MVDGLRDVILSTGVKSVVAEGPGSCEVKMCHSASTFFFFFFVCLKYNVYHIETQHIKMLFICIVHPHKERQEPLLENCRHYMCCG